MCAQLSELYLKLYKGTDNEEKNEISEQISAYYETPESLYEACQIIESNQQTPDGELLTYAASVGLRLIISTLMEAIVGTETFDFIKNKLMEFINGPYKDNILKSLIKAVSAVLDNKEIPWPEIFDFANGMLGSGDVQHTKIGLYLYRELLQSVNEEETPQIIETLIPVITTALGSTDISFVEAGASVLGMCFLFGSAVGEALIEPLNLLFQVFENFLQSSSASSVVVRNALENVFSSEFIFEDINTYIEAIIRLSGDENVDIEFQQHSLTLLCVILSNIPEAADLAEAIYTAVIDFAVRSFGVQDRDLYYVFNDVMYHLCHFCPKTTLLQQLVETVAPGGEVGSFESAQQAAFATAFKHLSDTGRDTLGNSIRIIFTFAMGCVSCEDGDAQSALLVIEAGFDLLCSLFQYTDAVFDENLQAVIESAVSALQVEDVEGLHRRALETISAALLAVSIPSDLIPELFGILQQAVADLPRNLHVSVIDALGALVESAGDNVSLIFEEVVPIFVEAAGLTEAEDAATKASAVLALSSLLPRIEDKDELIGLFLECADSGDCELITAGMDALSNTLSVAPDNFAPHVGTAIEVALRILATEVEMDDDTEGESANRALISAFEDTLKFISKGIKVTWEIFGQFGEQLIEAVKNLLLNPQMEPSIQAAAIRPYARLMNATGNPGGFLETVVEDELFGDEKGITIAIFRALEEYLMNSVVLTEEQIGVAIEMGMQATKREMACQQDDQLNENYDSELTPAVTDFFNTIGATHPNLFPGYEYFQIAKSRQDDEIYIEAAEMIDALGAFVLAAGTGIESLLRKSILRLFVAATDALEDYMTPPMALRACRLAFEAVPEDMAQYVPQLLERCHGLMSGENNGEICYTMTTQYAGSLVLTMQKQVIAGEFDFATFVPLILQTLPGGADEIGNIYNCLLLLCTDYAEQMGPYGQQMMVVLAKTLALRRDEFKEIEQDTQLLIAVAMMFQQLLTSLNDGRAVLDAEFANDPAGMELINQRLEEAANATGLPDEE